MIKKRVLIWILIVVMAVMASGCEALQQIVTQAIAPESIYTEEDTSDVFGQNASETIPIDALMGYDAYSGPTISGDGQYILYLETEDTYSVIAKDWQTGEEIEVVWPSGNGYLSYLWAPDDETVLFFIDSGGDENYGLYTSNVRTGETAALLEGGVNDCYYVSDNPDNEDEVYLAVFDFDRELFDLYVINYKTGDMTLVLKNPGDITSFVIDNAGRLRAVTTTDDKAGVHVWLKEDASDTYTDFSAEAWQEIFYWDYEDADTSGVFGFMPDDARLLYLDSTLGDTSTLCTYNVDTGEIAKVYNDPDYDINSTWTDLDIGEVTAVTVYKQMLEWVVLDESFEDDFEALSAVGDMFSVYDSSEDDAYWIVSYISDTQQPGYYAYEMATHEITFLYNSDPQLLEYDLSPVQPIAFAASDGLEIEGYITFPVDSSEKNLPTVVLVHGGPWVRDTIEYDPEVQFLANRGYAVLQVNYRGSAGYGKAFIRAGDKEWGGKMHQDIIDAVDYAIAEGWTDPERVAVYGASYGGYEALVCAAFSSDRFQCAVDAFGPSSLLTFIESIPARWSIEYQDLVRAIGDPDTEEALMQERSPLYFADEITIPMLIAQGENDTRVPKAESEQMVDALKTAGVDVTYMLLEDVGHSFGGLDTRIAFYSALEDFLAQHLGE